MARLHRATRELRSPLPSADAFDTAFAADLRRGLVLLEGPSMGWRAGQQRLRALLQPRLADLHAQLGEVEALCETVRARAGELVLCHTDMGGNNVLVSSHGGSTEDSVAVLDWDDLILAPPEHDLQEYRGAGFARFLRAYRAAGGSGPADPLQLRFYLLRRYLADLTDWLLRIMEENTLDSQDAADLAGVEGYCLPSLDGFEREMDGIREAIEQS
jgi:spectinomycin phosphotransferase